jgi:hypothetical protein
MFRETFFSPIKSNSKTKKKVSFVAARKKVGAERCENVLDAHTSKAGKELKVALLHLWRENVKTTRGFIYIPLEDLHMVKTAP